MAGKAKNADKPAQGERCEAIHLAVYEEARNRVTRKDPYNSYLTEYFSHPGDLNTMRFMFDFGYVVDRPQVYDMFSNVDKENNCLYDKFTDKTSKKQATSEKESVFEEEEKETDVKTEPSSHEEQPLPLGFFLSPAAHNYLVHPTWEVLNGDVTVTILDQGFNLVKSFEYSNVKMTGTDDCIGGEKLYDLGNHDPQTIYLLCVVRYTGSNPSVRSAGPLTDVKPPPEPSQRSAVVDENLNHELLDFLAASKDGDVSIVIGDRTFQAHKAFLMARSQYFRALFRSGMEEALSNRIVIEDVNPAIFEEILRFIYSGIIPKNITELSLPLLSLADRFGLPGLRDICESTVIRYVGVGNVVKILLHAHALSCARLVKHCLTMIRKTLTFLGCSDRAWSDLENARNHAVTVLVLNLFKDCKCHKPCGTVDL